MIAYALKTKQFIFKMEISFDGFKATVARVYETYVDFKQASA